MNYTQITNGQVKQMASEISKRWKFENHGSYYNCIDTKTGQRSNDGGAKNFAHYNFTNAIECAYLMCISCQIEKLLCGFTHEGREMAYERLRNSQAA